MKINTMILAFLLVASPALVSAAPPEGELYNYWSEPESKAFVVLGGGRYEISGKFVAVMSYEEKPQCGNHALIGELFDCSEMQYALAEMVEYDGNNLEISNFSNGNISKSFAQIEEDSRQEFLLIGICDEESGKPYELEKVRKYFQMIATSLEASEQMLKR